MVIDMPEKCAWCPLGRLFGIEGAAECRAVERVNRDCESTPDWCPLRPAPQKMQVCGKYPQSDGIVPSYKIGWNACVDAISGDE